MKNIFDLIVIGAGLGGTTAAKKAAALGARTALIEKEQLGGVCLNRGCIPSKFLLNNARQKVSPGELAQIIAAKDKVIEQLRQGLTEEIKQAGVNIFQGEAKLKDKDQAARTLGQPWTVSIRDGGQGQEISGQKIILATGSQPARPAVFDFTGQKVITAEEALSPRRLPENLLVIGGGAIGVEMAALYNGWGSATTLNEMQPRILPNLDRTVAVRLESLLKQQGIKLILNQKVVKAVVNSGLVEVSLEDGETRVYEQVIVATGRAYEKVEVDPFLAAAEAGIYAAGDVTGRTLLAHGASYEGMIAAENAVLGNKIKADYNAVPFCVYSRPEAGGVGLTEEQALAKGFKIKTVQIPYRSLGRAVLEGETAGLLKMVAAAAGGQILGIHLLGKGADCLLGEATVLLKQEVTVEQLRQIIHPHPSYSEILWEAAQRLAAEPSP